MGDDVDMLGFPQAADGSEAELRRRAQHRERVLAQRESWSAGVASYARMSSLDAARRDVQLVWRIRAGIPPEHRHVMWMVTCGATRKRQDAGTTYEGLLRDFAQHTSPYASQIEADLHRTFPEHPQFCRGGPGIERLRRVLVALAHWNPNVGYCQGLNFVAALLLLTVGDEPSAFWLLATIIEELLPNEFYGSSLLGVQVEGRVFERIVRRNLPRIAEHISALQLDLGAMAMQWFLSLFVGALPVPTVLRILDCFLLDGVSVLHRAGLAMLHAHEDTLLHATDEQVMSLLMNMSAGAGEWTEANQPQSIARRMYDAMCVGDVPKGAALAALRSEVLDGVVTEITVRQRKRNSTVAAPAELPEPRLADPRRRGVRMNEADLATIRNPRP